MILRFLLLFCLTSSAFAQTSLLDPASQDDLIRRALALVDPDHAIDQVGSRFILRETGVPDHGAHGPIKCGTVLTSEISANWGRLSKATQAKLSRLFQRQARQRTIVSQNDHFEIHFDTTGTHAVAHFDDDGNGIPDYVDLVAKTYEDVWDLEITQLGYREPIGDSDGRSDVYIKNLGNTGVYGLTWPDPGGTTTASYAEIDNNFTDNIYFTRGTDAVQVTAAHEFYHAIQFAYFAPFDSGWWQEATATWMEDVAYDDVNDYFIYVRIYLDDPEASLDFFSFGSLRPFGASLFSLYVADVYGPETIKATWESLATRTPSSYDIVDIELALPGGFPGVYPRFAIWNYFTGTRHRGGFHEEGSSFGDGKITTIRPTEEVETSDFERVDHFGATHIQIQTQGLSTGLRVTLDLDDRATWDVVVILVTATGIDILRPSGQIIEIPEVGVYDEVVVIPMVISPSGTQFSVDFSVLSTSTVQAWSDLVADFDGDGEVGFPDFLGFAESFGKTGAEGHNERHDLDANGRIEFSDFIKFSSRFGDKL